MIRFRCSICLALALGLLFLHVWSRDELANAIVPVNGSYLPVFGGRFPGLDVDGYVGSFVGRKGLNNRGTAVGNEEWSKPLTKRFAAVGAAIRWDNSGTPAASLGDFNPEPDAHIEYAQVFAINEAGVAVGHLMHRGESRRAVYWNPESRLATELRGFGTSAGVSIHYSATAVNDAGVIAGEATMYDSQTGASLGSRAVRWDSVSSIATELGHLGTNDEAYTIVTVEAINNSGVAVGTVQMYVDGFDSGERAVRWDAGATIATELGHLGVDADGKTTTKVIAINNSGVVVGQAQKYDQRGRYVGEFAVRWDPGVTNACELRDLGRSTDGSTVAGSYDINDAGTIVGHAFKFDRGGQFIGTRAVRWNARDGAAEELGHLGTNRRGGTHAFARAVNEANAAVGLAVPFDDSGYKLSDRHAVIWLADGKAIDLNSYIDPNAGWELTDAHCISDTGWIAGMGKFDPDGERGQAASNRLFLIRVSASAVRTP